MVRTEIKERRLFLGMTAHFGEFVRTVGGSVLFSLDLAFRLVALFLLAHLFFLTFVER